MPPFDNPRLIADIRSTYARFALETAPGVFSAQTSLRCGGHADFRAAVRAYLDTLPPGQTVEHAAVAIANPVEGDRVRMTNDHWEFSIKTTRQQLQLDMLVVVNEFTALAMSLPRLGARDLRQVGGGQAVPRSVICLIGAGTDLGVSGLIPAGDSWISVGSEGGHATFSPQDDREVAELRHAWKQFTGASTLLDSQLRALQAAPGSAIPSQIRRACSELSPAELRVAEQVLLHPRTVLNQPIVEIARAAQVSQPTMIRFCRSLGCAGLYDFKLRLASGLTGTVPITHVQVTHADGMVELGTKVLGNTASAILQVGSQLNREMIDRAVDLLAHANRVEFFTVGQHSGVALDAQFKFLRFGIPSAAHTDPRLQTLAVNLLKPGDVAVIISSGGRLPELLEVADAARARGASVVAITASRPRPLQRHPARACRRYRVSAPPRRWRA